MSEGKKEPAWKKREDLLVKMQDALLENLTGKLEDRDISHQEMKLAIDLLKHNAIDAYFDKEGNVIDITSNLPFKSPEDNVRIDDVESQDVREAQ